jgi:hypothetical protein
VHFPYPIVNTQPTKCKKIKYLRWRILSVEFCEVCCASPAAEVGFVKHVVPALPVACVAAVDKVFNFF